MLLACTAALLCCCVLPSSVFANEAPPRVGSEDARADSSSLFKLLDSDSNRQLSPVELKVAGDLIDLRQLVKADANGDKMVSEHELWIFMSRKAGGKHPPSPPPAQPTAAPRRCFERGAQNLRLKATVGFSDTTGSKSAADTEAESWVSEGATGNWAAEAVHVQGACRSGVTAKSRSGVTTQSQGTCDAVLQLYTKVLYIAASNTTYYLTGNVSSGSAGYRIGVDSCEAYVGERTSLLGDPDPCSLGSASCL